MIVRTQILTAGEKLQIGSGNFFRLLQSSAPVDIEFFDESKSIHKAVQVGGGFWLEAYKEEYTSAIITSVGAQTIQFGYGFGRIGLDQIQGFVSLSKSSTLSTIADKALLHGVATQILPADTSRRSATIASPVANTLTFRIGDALVTATRGHELNPGGNIVITSTAAIYGFNNDGAIDTQTVTVVIEKD